MLIFRKPQEASLGYSNGERLRVIQTGGRETSEFQPEDSTRKKEDFKKTRKGRTREVGEPRMGSTLSQAGGHIATKCGGDSKSSSQEEARLRISSQRKQRKGRTREVGEPRMGPTLTARRKTYGEDIS